MVRLAFQTLAEIDNLMVEKQKIIDKLNMTQKLKESFKGICFY